jgi:hypothetical protein
MTKRGALLGLNDGNCAKAFYAKCKLQDEYEAISSGIIIVAFNVMQSEKLKMNTKQLASAPHSLLLTRCELQN